MKDSIKIKGAREHNLKNVDLEIPKNKLVVFTGVSGSGKSSLAFDTIYAEGQRRYVESLSSYARQFLGIMQKPDVDTIEGLSPSISISQKTTSHNPRSTVGTVTEIYDYLRLLYSRVGHPHCPVCNREISGQTAEQIVGAAFGLITERAKAKKAARYLVLAPVVKDKKGEFASLFKNLRAKGFTRVRVDGKVFGLDENFALLKTNKHTIEVVLDRVSIGHADLKNAVFAKNVKSRLAESVEKSLELADGLVIISFITDRTFEMPESPKNLEDHLYSEKFSCPDDNVQISEIEPRTFSFNSPHGACPKCTGIGRILKVEPHLLFAPDISITQGGILPYATIFEHETWLSRLVLEFCKQNNIDPRTQINNLSKDQINLLLYGTGTQTYRVEGKNRFGRSTYITETFEGLVNRLETKYRETDSDHARGAIEKYMRMIVCPTCDGKRLREEALAVTVDEKRITDVTSMPIDEALRWVEKLQSGLSDKEAQIAKLILKEVATRLSFLVSVGLEYLTLGRGAGTLAGGEAQRIRLASQIGSGLTGVLYVLDEPTIGLHARDNKRLIDTLKHLKDLGNTIIVVEHDEEMMREADHVVDFGPGAGKHGGAVVAQGTVKAIEKNKASLTGKYLSGRRKIKVETPVAKSLAFSSNSKPNGELKIFGASQFNLKNLDVTIPTGKLVAVTGVSGSGKSTLVVETIYHALCAEQNPYHKITPGKFDRLEGAANFDKVILIDQSPIGKTPRSNPATYTKVFGGVRDIFSETKDAKVAGYKPGRFSFNVKGGRCEACEGQGQNKIEMQFMADIWVSCDVCGGARYNEQTLDIEYKNKNISDILNMTVGEAREFFHAHGVISDKLETLEAVGLDYIELGQPAPTLSGGEAQRVKLATELGKRDTGRTLYVLDEPTTGLHFADLEKLLTVLKILVSKGNTVLIIEHNLDVIKNADWVIDLGPEGGDKGGEVVATGTPAQIAKAKNSYTGEFLR